MKNIILIITLLVSSVSYSQVIKFEVDSFQRFKIPANMGMNEASRANKIEFYTRGSMDNQTWVINLNNRTIRVGDGRVEKLIAVIRYPGEEGLFTAYFDKNFDLIKIVIGNYGESQKNIVIVSRLDDDDITKQRGYFAYPTNYRTTLFSLQ